MWTRLGKSKASCAKLSSADGVRQRLDASVQEDQGPGHGAARAAAWQAKFKRPLIWGVSWSAAHAPRGQVYLSEMASEFGPPGPRCRDNLTHGLGSTQACETWDCGGRGHALVQEALAGTPSGKLARRSGLNSRRRPRLSRIRRVLGEVFPETPHTCRTRTNGAGNCGTTNTRRPDRRHIKRDKHGR